MSGEHERLLQFLYLCPVGVAEVDSQGGVRLLNALAIQLLLPLAGPDRLDNVFELLTRHAPPVMEAIQSFPKPAGTVCEGLVVGVQETAIEQHLSFTVVRIDSDSLLIAFTDVTPTVQEQLRAQAALEQEAVQKGKFELAAGVLHDVGNAVTGVGTRVARMLGDSEWEEALQLRKLVVFLEQQSEPLQQALGTSKAQALGTFLESVRAALEQRRQDYQADLEFLTRSLAHVQEVLNIQRLYVRHRQADEEDLKELISDALMMQQGSLEKRSVRTVVDCPRDLPPCSLDRTRFLQVLVNLIKNACESFDQCSRQDGRELQVSVRKAEQRLVVSISDNAAGFAPEAAAELFSRGQSSKSSGWGYGLSNCRQILAAHGGTVDISSPGPGLGARVVMTLPAGKEKECIAS